MQVSVVIPVLNEEETIGDCLRAILDQGPLVEEIIVVDNNSTDRTAEIVRGFAHEHPEVRLIAEPRAGLAYARYAGFDVAGGDIIAGIDADTHVEQGWAQAMCDLFEAHPQVGAGSAPALMYDLPFQGVYAPLHRAAHKRAARSADAGSPMSIPQVSGANTALRATVWKEVREKVSYRRDVFEDLDLSLHVKDAGYAVVLVPGMRATVSGRRMLCGPVESLRYALCPPRTYRQHGKLFDAAVSTVLILPILTATMVMLPVNRSWDPATKTFSVRRLRAAGRNLRESPVKAGLD